MEKHNGLNTLIASCENRLVQMILETQLSDDTPKYKMRQMRKLKATIHSLKRQRDKQNYSTNLNDQKSYC